MQKRRAAFQIEELLLFFFLLLASCQVKQNKMESRTSVKGILQDSAGKPLPNAVVMITGGSHSFNDMASITNDSGEFYLSNIVVPGNYTLQIEANNESKRKEVTVSGTDVIRIRF